PPLVRCVCAIGCRACSARTSLHVPASRAIAQESHPGTGSVAGHVQTVPLCRPSANPLLLLVHRSAFELFALRIGSARSDGAALAVSGHDNAAASGDLA